VLGYIVGQSVHQATTASLVVVTAGAVVGGMSHALEGRVCWRHALAFAAAAPPGVIAGTALAQAVSGRVLIAAFDVIMLAAAAATWRRGNRIPGSSTATMPRPSCPPLRVARNLAAGLLVGAMTGFFGVGGGVLIVPTLAVVLALSLRLAVGTSLVIITATSVMALAAHLAAGRTLDVAVTTAMTGTCIAGRSAAAASPGAYRNASWPAGSLRLSCSSRATCSSPAPSSADPRAA
jgi:uncharacterized membrane protein YfcA